MNDPSLYPLFTDFDNSFDLVETLGSGAFGTTYLIQVKDSITLPKNLPREYALKVYDLTKYHDPQARKEVHQAIITEATIIFGKHLRNVITYYGLYPVVIQGYPYLSVCMEYIDGLSLEVTQEYIPEIPPESEYPLLLLFRQVAYGIYELHLRNIAHRDIKPENILVRKDEHPEYEGDQVKIIDLGFACSNGTTTKEGLSRDISCRNVRGTPYYTFSPEFLALIPPSDIRKESIVLDGVIPMDIMLSTDIWAFGNTLFYFIYHRNAFEIETDDFRDLADAVLSSERVDVEPNLSVPRLNRLIDQCLLPMDRRPNAEQLLRDFDVSIQEILDEEEEDV